MDEEAKKRHEGALHVAGSTPPGGGSNRIGPDTGGHSGEQGLQGRTGTGALLVGSHASSTHLTEGKGGEGSSRADQASSVQQALVSSEPMFGHNDMSGGYSQGTIVGRGPNSAPSEPAYDGSLQSSEPPSAAAPRSRSQALPMAPGSHVRRMGLAELASATDHFCAGELIGSGGFGSVFRGTMADGTAVAVKRRARNSLQGEAEFFNEVSEPVGLNDSCGPHGVA